jgi:predicted amidohydrolase YtcJ
MLPPIAPRKSFEMQTADFVFTGAAVYTAGLALPERADVAVAAGEIVAVGDVSAFVGEHTREIDVGGRLIAPGFHDSHVHPIGAGVELLQCNLTASTSADDALARIAAYGATHAGESWVLGGGWSMEHYRGGLPTREALDGVTGGRPAALSNRDHHGLWVNSEALRLAGITRDTPDPVDGRIERDATGEPSGVLHEGAMALIDAVKPRIGAELAYEGLLRAQSELLALGITSWQDAMVEVVTGSYDSLDIYTRALSSGQLRVRVTAALWWDRDRGLSQLDELAERRRRISALDQTDWLRADTVKIMVDGVMENFTAAMSRPYLDEYGNRTGNSGLSFVDPAVLADAAQRLDAEGVQVHFHALGDRAVTEALDAVERARTVNGPGGGRHHLAHLQVVGEADAVRFAELDATANLQALWACHEPQLDELTLPFIDAGFTHRLYPFGDLADAGARLAGGSDWPVSTADPIQAMHVAVNRVSADADGEPLLPEQALTLASIFDAYTAGGAYLASRDHLTGHIQPGMCADLVILDCNPFELDPKEIHRTTVLSTWVDGQCVYEAATGNLDAHG